ncbi:hypothetical protein K491DRAFT_765300 [Lophiostoma macrostomum CBS 122681]|uniref:Uncharacterized protein n=1 Tax=Lophiostoma macrostomum CBS 122681 TaxID=1314788 RepID=A0A6A6TPJ7_9PLEO|nr:hypothetical protein K491DRAFT_765300 [Lophiostoma macrostomum CBS 122681]
MRSILVSLFVGSARSQLLMSMSRSFFGSHPSRTYVFGDWNLTHKSCLSPRNIQVYHHQFRSLVLHDQCPLGFP